MGKRRNEEAAGNALAAVPVELRQRPQWVLWKYEIRPGETEPTKVPHRLGGGRADATDPATWASFADTLLVAQNGSTFAGVGYVFSPDDAFTGVDLDDCLDGERLHPEAAAIVGALDTYTEISPSGTGVKLWVEASKNGLDRCQTQDTPWGGKFEAYDGARFFTVTGRLLRGCPATISANQPGLDVVLERMFGNVRDNEDEPAPGPRPEAIFTPDDERLLEVALAAKNGDKLRRLLDGDTSMFAGDDSRADAALAALLAFWSDDPAQVDRLVRGSGLYRPKWDERRGESTYGAITVANAIKVVKERFDWSAFRGQGQRVTFVETNPSGDVAPDIATLLDDVERFVRRFVAMGEAEYVAVTLWVAHTWAIDATSTTPYLHITSPEWESGKSRLMETIELLVLKPMFAASMSTAVLFRAVQQYQPVLLVDEADNLFKDREARSELLGLLNAGYRQGALAYRVGGGNRDEIQSFKTFSAKAIAGLDDLIPTLASRCIRIVMRRRHVGERIDDLYRDEADEDARPIREGLAVWAKEQHDTLRCARPDRLGVRDRLEEGLRLPLAIAEQAGERWTTRARDAFRELAGVSTDGAMSERVQLLADIRIAFDANPGDDELPTLLLLDTLMGFEESPWRDQWGVDVRADGVARIVPSKGAAMKLAGRLKGFGIKSRPIGPVEARVRGYRRSDFEDVWRRYLPLSSPTPPPEAAQAAQTA